LKQAGSLVAPDRLRFDFSHGKPISAEDLRAIESEVNARILEDLPVETEVTSIEEARAKGAMALFGEKYGDRVRQVIVGNVSRELCGGCHVRRTGEIGYLRVETETAIASGTRRVEAVTGALAYRHAEEDRAILRELAQRLGAPKEGLVERLAQIQDEAKRIKDSRALQSKMALRERVRELVDAAKGSRPPLVVAEVEAGSVDELREAGDLIRSSLPEGAGMLAAAIDGKLSVLASVGTQAVGQLPADQWVRDAVSIVGGKGGGKKDSAVAGAKDTKGLSEVLARGRAYAEERLKSAGAPAAGAT
jgi:alanyl-tRNA synthetase